MFDLSMFGSDTISKPRKKHSYPKYVSKLSNGNWSVNKTINGIKQNFGVFKCIKTAKKVAAAIDKDIYND
ncbi:hypothetical protein SEPB62_19071 [Salmonella enterica subsp. enterica serovar Paratyphi B str. SARA62]|uniref:Uncharacterized protein n=3 Tax=Salmonella enterica TaxID=28901 RepID=A0A753Z8G4_SALER|nr:hypothetical protein [Salmonella enterica]ECK9403491.1 hypothetical protein [Salmonella enterica subsp. enterica serovar Paratyphi C str. CFSAN000603]QUZ43906.1 hypothetical protein JYM88_12020 [Salmonella enterica subsp. enterica serovar Paratyphi B str. CFSAN000549]HAB6612434.1 hypothetical protein [Salmonella enterica subsp. enterica serovar Paratyphi C]HAE8363015.1 hypothetical protein [Salmonella enterica subsp. enterica serovar Paratyphi B]ESE73122.1 hypothetical protein SEPB62_19071 